MRAESAVILSLALVLSIVSPLAWAADKEADHLVEKSETQTRGNSFQGEMSMKVTKNGEDRALNFKVWSSGRNLSMIKVLSPARDRGTANLRIDLNLWQYLPNLDRTIKIPPSMMLQSWMGSDFTNDDLVKTSSLSSDYTHKVLAHEKIDALNVVKIECLPKPTAPVVWGKVILWVTQGDAVPVKEEFYTEKGKLVKSMEGSEIKTFGSHKIPTTLKMKTLSQADGGTTMHYDSAEFDKKINPSIFTQEFLRKEPQ